MPNNSVHRLRSLERYGVEGGDIHTWMDEPTKVYSADHRVFRHDSDWIPKFFIDKYGEDLARNIMLDHIIYDNSHQHPFKPEKETIGRSRIENIQSGWKNIERTRWIHCPKCNSFFAVKKGFSVVRPGMKKQRWQCRDCGKTFYHEEET